MRRKLVVCLVIGLVLTAGCLELPGSSGSDSTGSANTSGSGAASQQLSALVESHKQAVLSEDVRVTQTLNQSVERDEQNSSIAQRTVIVGSVNRTAYQDRTITNIGPYSNTTTQTERYREANGTVYTRDRSGSDDPDISIGTGVGLDVASLATVSGNLVAPENASYESVGIDTVAGVTGQVWVAEGTTAVRSGLRDRFNGTIEAFESVIVGSPEEGHLSYAQTRVIGTNQDGVRFKSNQTVRWHRVGTVTVPSPDWLETARTQAAQPGPDDIVTETFSYDGPDGLVTLNVTATKYSLTTPGAVGLQRLDNPVFVNEFTNQSRVGQPVRAYWLSANNLQSVELTFYYNETAVPGGNESALVVVSESFETPLLDRLENSTVDATQNSVSVTLSDQSLLERWQGEQFFVIQWNAYLETVQNRPP